uniref:Uncharacterized protein n=1 Tax=viral metagenome TaxID=1070528 RepID=A0A6M3KL31_9ZZZZ
MVITKEAIEKAFKEADLPIDKIKKSKLGGFYVYHPFGSQYVYIKYTIVERGEGYVKKLREPIRYSVSFIDDESLLEIAIMEAKNRKKWSNN